MKRTFGIMIGFIIGLIGAYSICSMLSMELHPSKWESGVKALCTFIIMLSVWVFNEQE